MDARARVEKESITIDFLETTGLVSFTDSLLQMGSFLIVLDRELAQFKRVHCTVHLSSFQRVRFFAEVIQTFGHPSGGFGTALQIQDWSAVLAAEVRARRQSVLQGLDSVFVWTPPAQPETPAPTARKPRGERQRELLTRTPPAAREPARPGTPPGQPPQTASPSTSPPSSASPAAQSPPVSTSSASRPDPVPSIKPAPQSPPPSSTKPTTQPTSPGASRTTPQPTAPASAASSKSVSQAATSPFQPAASSPPKSAQPSTTAPSDDPGRPTTKPAQKSSQAQPDLADDLVAQALAAVLQSKSKAPPTTTAPPKSPPATAASSPQTPTSAAPPASHSGATASTASPVKPSSAIDPGQARSSQTLDTSLMDGFCGDQAEVSRRFAAARTADSDCRKTLATSRSMPVLLGLLANPQLQQPELVQLLQGLLLPEPFVVQVSTHPRWGRVPEVQYALCAAVSTPLPVVNRLLGNLRRPELNRLSENPKIRESVRRLAHQFASKNWSSQDPPPIRRVTG